MTGTTLIDRALLRFSGEDAKSFLQGLITHDVNGPLPIWAGLLTAQGKLLFDFIVWGDGEDILLDCEAEQAEALKKRLTMYRLRKKVKISVEDSLTVHWALENPGDSKDGVPDPRLPALGHRWLAPADAAGADHAEAWRKHRLSLGVTEGAAELGSDLTLWLECNAAELNGVSFTKGCYVGQENTARMNWRQKVNRRLVVVPIEQTDEKRQRIAYPDFGVSVEFRRVENIPEATAPEWLKAALVVAEE